jgi:hypothetical protein
MENESDGDVSVSESDSPDVLYRPDNGWYHKPYEVLQNFACGLKAKVVASSTNLPHDVCETVGNHTKIIGYGGTEREEIAKKASKYILDTLREEMNILQQTHPECVYLENDQYMNVIRYMRALHGDDFIKWLNSVNGEEGEKYLVDNILPWLGLTNWNSTTGGRTTQLHIFKRKLRNFLGPPKKPEALLASAASSGTPLSLDELRAARMTYIEKEREKRQRELREKNGIHKKGGAKRKIMLKDHHMNLQPSAPISGQKIKRVKPFTIKDPSKYLERLRSSPCRSKSQKKCNSRKLRGSCKYARGAKRSFCRRRTNKNYRS